MSKQRKTVAKRAKVADHPDLPAYGDLVDGIAEILETARRASARAVNAVMTATYWEIGRRIVEYEQGGKRRAEYGDVVLKKLGKDLTASFGRGFGWRNLFQMRGFYLTYPPEKLQTVSATSLGNAAPLAEKHAMLPRIPGGEQILQTLPAISPLTQITNRFRLPWSAYVRLLAVKNENARTFYETEALRAGWSVRQLDRPVQSHFYERTALSRNKAAMLTKGARPQPDDTMSLGAVTPSIIFRTKC